MDAYTPRYLVRFLLIGFILITFSGCSSTPRSPFFHQLSGLNEKELKTHPSLFYASDMTSAYQDMLTKKYYFIGSAIDTGYNPLTATPEEIKKYEISNLDYARKIGALVVLINENYATDKHKSTYRVGVMGIIDEGNPDDSSHPQWIDRSYTADTPVGTMLKSYQAYYFIKLPVKPRFGIYVTPISERIDSLENGAYTFAIIEGSAADKSDLRRGDIIYSFNEIAVHGYKHMTQLMQTYPKSKNTARLKVLREGKEKTIKIELN